jgi:hypothetical protein
MPTGAIDTNLSNILLNPTTRANKDDLLKDMLKMLQGVTADRSSNSYYITKPSDNTLKLFYEALLDFKKIRDQDLQNPAFETDRLRIVVPTMKNGGILKFQKGGIKYAPTQRVPSVKTTKPVEIKKPEILQENDS